MSVENLKKKVAKAKEGKPEEVQALAVDANAKLSVTVGELDAACKANPAHPSAVAWTGLLAMGLKESHPVVVDRVDLEALLENKAVVVERTTVDGQPIATKKLGDTLGKTPAPAPTPGK